MKKIIVVVVFVICLLGGFISGKIGTYKKNDSYIGTYSEKTIQNEAGPFQMSFDNDTYQYVDPGTSTSGTGSYHIIDKGVLVLDSGDLSGMIVVCEKQFFNGSIISLYDSNEENTIVLIKSTDNVSDLTK